MTISSGDKERVVRLRVGKTKGQQESLKLSMPRLWSLSKTINSLLEFTHMSGKIRRLKAKSLLHKDIIREETLQKDIVDI